MTDVEASKLTLDALTATPRPVYRSVAAFRRVHGSGSFTHSAHLRSAAYHRRSGSRSKRH